MAGRQGRRGAAFFFAVLVARLAPERVWRILARQAGLSARRMFHVKHQGDPDNMKKTMLALAVAALFHTNATAQWVISANDGQQI